MLKDALQYLIGLGNVRTEQIGNEIFSTQPLHRVKEATADPIIVHSLSGFVDYLIHDFDKKLPLMVHVVSPTEVVAFSSFNRDYERNVLIKAQAMLPDPAIGRWLDVEEFIIRLQAAFLATEDRSLVLKVVGNIKEESVNTIGDDGVSQSVVAKTGVATVGNVKVPNPVFLHPYRTFVELDQPGSQFVFRMQSGLRCALFEADGGAWKIEAMRLIRDYLSGALEDELHDERVILIA